MDRKPVFPKENEDEISREIDIFYGPKFVPNNIYNVVEQGFTTITDPRNLLTERGQKTIGAITSGKRDRNITLICANSIAGNFIPPIFIFPRERITYLMKNDGSFSALYKLKKQMKKYLLTGFNTSAYAKPYNTNN